jgi:melanoma-associated antigen p97
VSFVKHTALYELAAMNKSININNYELLCPNYVGSPYNTPGYNTTIYPYPTAPISDFVSCNWGIVPGRAILTSSRKALQQRRSYREFLKKSAQLFMGKAPANIQPVTITEPPISSFSSVYNQTAYQQMFLNPHLYQPVAIDQHQRFYIFDSALYSSRNLLFFDSTVSFIDLSDRITYVSFLPELYRNKILKLYECPLRLVRWCVISDFEKEKCKRMKNAFASRNIKPDLDCVSADTAWDCMSMIKNKLADLITLDPADAYRAQRYFQMQPLAAEDYGTQTEKPIYYAVAVVKRFLLLISFF